MGLESGMGGSESRCAAYVEAITSALGHANRTARRAAHAASGSLAGLFYDTVRLANCPKSCHHL